MHFPMWLVQLSCDILDPVLHHNCTKLSRNVALTSCWDNPMYIPAYLYDLMGKYSCSGSTKLNLESAKVNLHTWILDATFPNGGKVDALDGELIQLLPLK
jgi:hypothetical protein